MNRGVRHEQVFFDDDSYGMFLSLVGNVVERYGIRIHGFALMPNHYHLMVESVRGNLSVAMKELGARYSQGHNLLTGGDGALFRGRFKNKLVIEPEHWLHLLPYLHLNPVRARLTNRVDGWTWTSHDNYAHKRRWPEWLSREDLESRLEGVGGYGPYLKGVRAKKIRAPADFDRVTYEGRTGGRMMVTKQESVGTGLSADEALAQVSALTGATVLELKRTKRGRTGSPVRVLALWWLVYGAGLTNEAASGVLGMSPSAASKILKKIREDRENYHSGVLTEWMLELNANESI
jgi:REP element-mobilizing transposase RayT